MKVPGYELALGQEVPPRAVDTHETTVSPSWTSDWLDALRDAIRVEDAWGVIVQRPNMDVWLYDAADGSLARAVMGGGTAWLIIALPS